MNNPFRQGFSGRSVMSSLFKNLIMTDTMAAKEAFNATKAAGRTAFLGARGAIKYGNFAGLRQAGYASGARLGGALNILKPHFSANAYFGLGSHYGSMGWGTRAARMGAVGGAIYGGYRYATRRRRY